jgi:hypothetical protein
VDPTPTRARSDRAYLGQGSAEGGALLDHLSADAWVYYRVVPERLETIRTALETRLPRARTKKRA